MCFWRMFWTFRITSSQPCKSHNFHFFTNNVWYRISMYSESIHHQQPCQNCGLRVGYFTILQGLLDPKLRLQKLRRNSTRTQHYRCTKYLLWKMNSTFCTVWTTEVWSGPFFGSLRFFRIANDALAALRLCSASFCFRSASKSAFLASASALRRSFNNSSSWSLLASLSRKICGLSEDFDAWSNLTQASSV